MYIVLGFCLWSSGSNILTPKPQYWGKRGWYHGCWLISNLPFYTKNLQWNSYKNTTCIHKDILKILCQMCATLSCPVSTSYCGLPLGLPRSSLWRKLVSLPAEIPQNPTVEGSMNSITETFEHTISSELEWDYSERFSMNFSLHLGILYIHYFGYIRKHLAKWKSCPNLWYEESYEYIGSHFNFCNFIDSKPFLLWLW